MSLSPIFTVNVVEDDASLRSAIASLIRSFGLAVRTYSSAEDFLSSAMHAGPGCLLLDVRLPGSSGVELQSTLNNRGNQMPIVFLTGHGTIPMTVDAMRAGAVEFLTKPFSDNDLLAAIERARELAKCHTDARAADKGLHERYASLSPRQREVFELVTAGRLNKVIAAERGITEASQSVLGVWSAEERMVKNDVFGRA